MLNVIEFLLMTVMYPKTHQTVSLSLQLPEFIDICNQTPGLINLDRYQCTSPEATSLLLTTWEDETCWSQAKQQYLQEFPMPNDLADTATSSFSQWCLSYLWGYYQPTSTATNAELHITEIPHTHIDPVRQAYLKIFQHPQLQTHLSYSFIAQGTSTNLLTPSMPQDTHTPTNSTFLATFLSWPTNNDKQLFMTHSQYQILAKFMKNLGTRHTFQIELS